MKYAIFTFIIVLFVSCNAGQIKADLRAENEKEIIKYIEDNGLIAGKSDTGLHFVIREPGTGIRPRRSDKVTVAYKGYFTNGAVFDKSDANGISFDLQEVIKGWREGIRYLKEGGSGTLLIPAHLGYGRRSVGPIPAGSVLLFDITLISVN
ncbi:FKBP-type peptidyl-prolyl cis-trans isomerase [uncultured Aquimarina sp.]|uniref:FKBP-type peptidyl-prolyl cis-trans isomerase n=1 Tax=uncultured Aquimarina sp. TaxID=575652 RepID=UPI00261811BC|nr:FKBP-type peptidyl-prolyl cis-trans isomerase [uncultured Aquimarina sp.]